MNTPQNKKEDNKTLRLSFVRSFFTKGLGFDTVCAYQTFTQDDLVLVKKGACGSAPVASVGLNAPRNY